MHLPHLLAGLLQLGMRYPFIFLRLSALVLAVTGLLSLVNFMNRQGQEERAILLQERQAVFGPEDSGYNPDYAFWQRNP